MSLYKKWRRRLIKTQISRRFISRIIITVVLFGLIRNLIELYFYGAYWQNVRSVPLDAFDQPNSVLSRRQDLMYRLSKIANEERNDLDDELGEIIRDLMFRRVFEPKEKVFSLEKHSLEFEYLMNVFSKRKKGVFVEIGAREASSIERIWFLSRQWNVFVVEPSLHKISSILTSTNQSIHALNSCISTKTQLVNIDSWWHILKIGHTYLPCFTPNSLFAAFRLASIDFLSLDAVGDELRVLSGIDFNRISIRLVRVRQLVYEKRRDLVIKQLLKNGFEFKRQIDADMFFYNDKHQYF